MKINKIEMREKILLPSTVEETSIVYIKEEDVKNAIQGKVTDLKGTVNVILIDLPL